MYYIFVYLSYFYGVLWHVNILNLTGKIEAGIPKITLPPFSSQVGNQTYTFLDMCAHYGLGLGLLPIISVSVNVAIAKAFGINFYNSFNNFNSKSDSKLP